jgi:predicted metal-dependent hydrolase
MLNERSETRRKEVWDKEAAEKTRRLSIAIGLKRAKSSSWISTSPNSGISNLTRFVNSFVLVLRYVLHELPRVLKVPHMVGTTTR